MNSKNDKGTTALMIAAAKGHHDVLKRLANSPNILLQEQVLQKCRLVHRVLCKAVCTCISLLLWVRYILITYMNMAV